MGYVDHSLPYPARLLVLHSQARRSPLLTLTGPEALIRSLLDLLAAQRFGGTDMNGNGREGGANGLHSYRGAGAVGGSGNSMQYRYASPVRGGLDNRRPPSFLSGGPPRDRRGRVAGKMDPSATSAGAPPPVPPKDPQHQPQGQQQQGGDAAWRRAGRVLDMDDDELDYGQVLSGGMGYSGYGGYGGYGSGYGYGSNGGGVGSGMSINLSSLSRMPPSGPGGRGLGSFSGDMMSLGGIDGEDDMGMLTPRTRFSVERERDRTFLESLRSPNPVDQEDEEEDDEDRMRPGIGEEVKEDPGDERAAPSKSTERMHVTAPSNEVGGSDILGPKSGLEHWDEVQVMMSNSHGSVHF